MKYPKYKELKESIIDYDVYLLMICLSYAKYHEKTIIHKLRVLYGDIGTAKQISLLKMAYQRSINKHRKQAANVFRRKSQARKMAA